MKILILLTNDAQLKEIFADYNGSVKKFFARNSIDEQPNPRYYAAKIEDRLHILGKDKKIEVFDENEFLENIQDAIPRNLLMNGLYEKEKLASLLDQYASDISPRLSEYFRQLISRLKPHEYTFIWNTGEDEVNEILQSKGN